MRHEETMNDRRRRLLQGMLYATACAGSGRAIAVTGPDAARQRLQLGDELAFASYENDGRLVAPEDLKAGDAPLIVWPRDPASGVTRERSRLNQILVLRLDAGDAAGAETIDGGVIAFSGICTHAACGVTEWNAGTRHFVCPCHASEYNPRQRAKVVAGPAPRALPGLPLERREDRYVIAGPFSDALGART